MYSVLWIGALALCARGNFCCGISSEMLSSCVSAECRFHLPTCKESVLSIDVAVVGEDEVGSRVDD